MMKPVEKSTDDKPAKTIVRPLSLILLIGLILLRIPFVTFLRMALGNPSPEWIEHVFQVGTYLLTAVFIWAERDHLDEFFITPLALGMIFVFKPLQPVLEYLMGITWSPLVFPKPLSFIYLAITIGLLAALWFSKWRWKRIAPAEWKWLGIGVLGGIGLLIVDSIPMAFSIRSMTGNFDLTPSDWSISFLRIPQQLGYAAVTEEPLFRGILWGILLKYGWKNGWILIFQTLLFMSGHAYYFGSAPLSFWIIIPAAGLGLGLLVWRSRTIASSLAAHAVGNAFG
ncbi:MAG: CPBP family intramembrane metalloprotease, partial [Anaerolineaceae bacterium]|nr:CPBP family intramembrane metalloprotease [Anaerolineaceae bacterium]